MSLFASLTSVTNALAAQSLGLDVVGQNLANVNTPGYARRSLELASTAPTSLYTAGRGVDVLGIRAFRDAMVDSRVWREHGGTASDGAIADFLSTVEVLTGLPGTSLDSGMQRLFASFAALADDPTSAVARDIVVREAQNLGTSFRSMALALDGLRADADAEIRSQVHQINQLTTELAKLNGQIAAGGSDVEALKDRQAAILAKLGEMAGVSVIPGDVGVDVTLASGQALVIGEKAQTLELSSTFPTSISIDGVAVTSGFAAGRVGGLLQVRDGIIPGYVSSLDRIAFDIAAAVNAVHVTGFDANGAAAGNFFAPIAVVAGAASALNVDAAIVSDTQRVAASATGAIGDNAVARQLAALRDAPITGGGTRSALQAWSDYVFTVGTAAADARAAEASHEQILIQLQGLQAQVSGVSTDEEAAHMMKYQRAYEANARYFQTILQTLDTLMDMVQ